MIEAKSVEVASTGFFVITTEDSFLPNQSETVWVPIVLPPVTASVSVVLPVALSYWLS